jgi:hypothetical protein
MHIETCIGPPWSIQQHTYDVSLKYYRKNIANNDNYEFLKINYVGFNKGCIYQHYNKRCP